MGSERIVRKKHILPLERNLLVDIMYKELCQMLYTLSHEIYLSTTHLLIGILILPLSPISSSPKR